MSGTFELRDHTADVAVEATGPTLDAVFAAVAAGLTAAMIEELPEDGGETFAFEERAESREALLFEYLDRLIYERDVREVMPTDHQATVEQRDGEWVAECTARGVPLAGLAAREVKAVTYSQMTLEERDGEWYAYVVFDV